MMKTAEIVLCDYWWPNLLVRDRVCLSMRRIEREMLTAFDEGNQSWCTMVSEQPNNQNFSLIAIPQTTRDKTLEQAVKNDTKEKKMSLENAEVWREQPPPDLWQVM